MRRAQGPWVHPLPYILCIPSVLALERVLDRGREEPVMPLAGIKLGFKIILWRLLGNIVQELVRLHSRGDDTYRRKKEAQHMSSVALVIYSHYTKVQHTSKSQLIFGFSVSGLDMLSIGLRGVHTSETCSGACAYKSSYCALQDGC